MARNNDNAVSIVMAVVLHAAILASMFAAFDWARPTPITPMAIQATLVMDIPDPTPLPPLAVEKAPEPEPIAEEIPPEPDNSAELQRAAEEKKRVEDALIEKQRLEEIRQREEAERERQRREEEAERELKRREAEDRKKAEDERKERERVEAEQKRQDDIKRQREENERIRRELEAEERAEELENEERRLAANDSPAMAAYQFAISQKIRRNWSVPASASADTVCIASVRQVAGGEIVGVTILSCNGDDAVKRSVEAAIYRSSPLPDPSNPDLFRPILELTLQPEQ